MGGECSIGGKMGVLVMEKLVAVNLNHENLQFICLTFYIFLSDPSPIIGYACQ